MRQPPRVAWREFPDAILLAAESRTKRHPAYPAAKSGDAAAAALLVDALVEDKGIADVRSLLDGASRGCAPVLLDDFIGQGGTLANLRGWVETSGATVIGAVGLTGKAYSAVLNPSREQLHALRQKHGTALEQWWRERFGHAFDCLTQSEARYLTHAPNIGTIRNRIAAA